MNKTCTALLLSALLLLSAAAGCSSPSDPDAESSAVMLSSGASSDDVTASADTIAPSGDNSAVESEGSNSTTKSSNNGGSHTASTTKRENGKKVVNNCYTTGLPLAKDRVKFSVMIRDHSGGQTKYDAKNQPMIRWMEDTFNVTVEFTAVQDADVQSKMTLGYVAGNAPDMYWGMAANGYDFHGQYVSQGKLLEVGKYLDEYGPNIKKMFAEQKTAEYLCTNEHGKIYMLPKVTVEDTFATQMYINTTWLQKAGKRMPTTTDELKDVLIHFKNNDMNGNGNKNDEVPMIMPQTAGWMPPSLISSFGYSTYLDFLSVDQNGKVVFVPMTEEYRNYMRFYRELYSEGLLYENFINLSDTDLKNICDGPLPRAGVIVMGQYDTVMSPERFLSDYSLVPPLKASTTGKPLWGYTTLEAIHNDWFIITSNCKYPEIATRMADYFYSTEGTTTAFYGPPGKNNAWYKDANGKFIYNIAKKPADKTTGAWLYQFTPGYSIPHYVSDEYLKYTEYNSPNPTVTEKAEKKEKEQIAKYYKPAIPEKILYKVNFTAAENAEMKKLGDYFKYAHTMSWSFLGGDANLDNDWDNYINELKRLGAEKAVAIRQKALDRYTTWLKNQ